MRISLPWHFVPAARVPLLILCTALLVGSCGNDATGQRDLQLAECRLPHLANFAQCGELEVPEDRGKPQGRRIKIFVAVLPANTLSPKTDPFVILAGGPGQSASHLGPFATRLTELRRTRDIVLIDQRGTGRSSPLVCDAFKNLDEVLDADPVPRAAACARQLREQGIDPAQYTTTSFIADLDAMRHALGYARMNLWGGSYGSRVAQEYLRRFPERVRTVVLDGVAPPAMTISLDVWRTRAAALTAVWQQCVQAAECRKAHPDPAATLAEIGKSLANSRRDVELIDPRTGQPRTLPVTFDAVLSALQPLTYIPELSVLLPELLDRAARGDYGPLFATIQSFSSNLTEQMNAALHFSVTCAEDVPRISPDAQARGLADLPTRAVALRTIDVCRVWPRGTMPAEFGDPVRSDKPILMLSGGADPVTPPAYGALVAKSFPNSRHIVAPGYGHIVSPHVCGPRLIAAFVEAAGFAQLPQTCVRYFESSVPPPPWPNQLAP